MRWSLVRIHGRGPLTFKKLCVSCSLLRDCSQVTSQLDLHSNPTHGDRQTHVKSCNHEGFDLFPTSDVRIPMKMTACYTSKWQNHQEHFTNLFCTFLVVSCYILLRKLALQPFTNSTDLQSIDCSRNVLTILRWSCRKCTSHWSEQRTMMTHRKFGKVKEINDNPSR